MDSLLRSAVRGRYSAPWTVNPAVRLSATMAWAHSNSKETPAILGEALEAFRHARAAVNSLPQSPRSAPALFALQETVSEHLDKDTPR